MRDREKGERSLSTDALGTSSTLTASAGVAAATADDDNVAAADGIDVGDVVVAAVVTVESFSPVEQEQRAPPSSAGVSAVITATLLILASWSGVLTTMSECGW